LRIHAKAILIRTEIAQEYHQIALSFFLPLIQLLAYHLASPCLWSFMGLPAAF
jgi:hypothetical protein